MVKESESLISNGWVYYYALGIWRSRLRVRGALHGNVEPSISGTKLGV